MLQVGEAVGCGREGIRGETLALMFMVWLFLSVLTSEVVYRTFFHLLIYPLVIYLLIRVKTFPDWNDPFLRLFLVFCGYMAVSTWFVGSGPVSGDLQATRWGVEAALGMLSFFAWMTLVVKRPEFWGRAFLGVALTGSAAGLVVSSLGGLEGTRSAGLGIMGHPIQGASVAIVLMAVGVFLSIHKPDRPGMPDVFLIVTALVVTCVFVVMTKSRAPIGALMVYLVFLIFTLGSRYRPAVSLGLFAVGLVITLGVIHLIVDLPVLFDQLTIRGDSYRLEIWKAYLTYPPESLVMGNGAGLDFSETEASRLYLESMGLEIAHPHNIWLGVFVETGFIGVLMQLGLFVLPAWAVIKSSSEPVAKLHLFGLLSLFLMLTFTDEFSLLISLHPVWISGWIPLVFVWLWSRRKTPCRKDHSGLGQIGESL